MDEELYLRRQMEKTIVELLKVKMPGLIRLNSAAGGWNDVQLPSGFVLLIGVMQVECWKVPQSDLPDGRFHTFHVS